MEENKKHWYNLSFVTTSSDLTSTELKFSSIMVYGESKFITQTDISEAKKSLEIKKDSVLLSCSYLGFMTSREAGSKNGES